MASLSHDVLESMVQCFGRSFHYKDVMVAFLVAAGVGRAVALKGRDLAKFVSARNLLTELGETEEGCLLQRHILTELCRLRQLPDPAVKDRDDGLTALRELKRMAQERNLFAQEEAKKTVDRKRLSNELAKSKEERKQRLNGLRLKFIEAMRDTNRQKSGYSLEGLLKDMFHLFEIEYTKSYRTETRQVDGKFILDSFHYLIEARWRKELPTEQDIGGFKNKVDAVLESTRGLFVSVPGFRDEVVRQFDGRGAKVILMSGEDLIHVLEGRMHLKDGLRYKIERAAQVGKVYCRLSEISA